MSREVFDESAWRYEALVDWEKRLAHEAPFYRDLFAEVGVESVLDAACGSGRHAGMFHSWGLRVEGADISPGMIELCRARLGESDSLRWQVRPFDQPADPPASFDAVVCVGNSLSLAPDAETIQRAVRAMLESVRPGGVCVIQVLNIWSLPDGPMVWQKTRRVRHDGGDHVLLKGIHRSGRQAWIVVLDLTISRENVESSSESTCLEGIEAADLISAAKTAGASRVDTFGNYGRTAYNRDASPDLIMVCRK